MLQEEVSREEEPELRRGWGVEGDMGGEVEGLSTGGEVIWHGRRLHGSEEDDRVVFRAAQPRRDSLQVEDREKIVGGAMMAGSKRWRADPHGGGGDDRGNVDHRRSGGGLGCDGGGQGYEGERRESCLGTFH